MLAIWKYFLKSTSLNSTGLRNLQLFPIALRKKSGCPMEVTNITCQLSRVCSPSRVCSWPKKILHFSQSHILLLFCSLNSFPSWMFLKPACLLITFKYAFLSPLPYFTFYLAHSLSSTQSVYHMLLEHPSFFTFSL